MLRYILVNEHEHLIKEVFVQLIFGYISVKGLFDIGKHLDIFWERSILAMFSNIGINSRHIVVERHFKVYFCERVIF